MTALGKTSIEKKRFLSGIARIMGGGSTHARIFWPLFLPSNSPFKIAFLLSLFYFTVIVCYFSHFCHNYHQNYQNYHHNYHCNHHDHHQKKFRSYAQNVIFDVQKRGPSCPNWGQGEGGLGDSGNARKKTFFSIEVFPN